MEEFKKELKELLEKHNAYINVEQEENDSFLYLQLCIGTTSSDFKDEKVNIDSGYRDLQITENNL